MVSLLADGQVPPPVERASLKTQAVDLLRQYIAEGRLPPGTKLVEREVAEALGISRAPARDALLELEKEGLVVTRSTGRHVIELSERDIRELYAVRVALETLAVELAAQHTSPAHQQANRAKLDQMRDAVARHDPAAFTRADIETHTLIWQQADNHHLLRNLQSILGPIFMFVATTLELHDWGETLAAHTDLITAINAGDVPAARASLGRHLDESLRQALHAFHVGNQTTPQ